MTPQERAIVQVLSLFQSPVPTEALLVGSGEAQEKALDAVDELVSDSVIQRFFDPDRNDYTYGLLPMARAFIYGAVSEQADLEAKIRRRLEEWFEARDIQDPGQRLVVREIRQGKGAAEAGLVDLARSAERRGDIDTADQLYKQALQRNPRSWKAARHYAEFQRHVLTNTRAALELYGQAAAHAPRRRSDRGLIYREWRMLLRNSGLPDATDLAIEKFETALLEMPNDPVTVHALATMYDRKGAYYRVIELLEPFESHAHLKTREMAIALLMKSYERLGDERKVAELKSKYDRLRS
jgi:tetratricopeptide (TPR) repeat protein